MGWNLEAINGNLVCHDTASKYANGKGFFQALATSAVRNEVEASTPICLCAGMALITNDAAILYWLL